MILEPLRQGMKGLAVLIGLPFTHQGLAQYPGRYQVNVEIVGSHPLTVAERAKQSSTVTFKLRHYLSPGLHRQSTVPQADSRAGSRVQT